MENFLYNQVDFYFQQDISSWDVENVTNFTNLNNVLPPNKLPPKFRIDPMLSNFNNVTKTFGDEPFDLTPPHSLNTDVAFSYTSSNPDVATISGGNTVIIVGAGTTTITATQSYNNIYRSASISATLTVTGATLTVTDVVLDGYGSTYKFVGTVPTNATNPFFVEGYDGQYYAVMQNSTDSITIIKQYAQGTTTNFERISGDVDTLIPFNRIVTTNMTNMSQMFSATSFNQPIGSWDTSNVTNMSGMFGGTTLFNQPIGSWDTSEVTNMSGMFANADKFNQPIESWDTSKVTNMSGMFSNAEQFNQDISGWNVDSVTNFFSFSIDPPLSVNYIPLLFRSS
jgi:surface protein